MAVDVQTREQRLRKQAELQSLQLNLTSLRKQEASYISASATIPDLLLHQIVEQRQKIQQVETDLLALKGESAPFPGRDPYWAGLQQELTGEYNKAINLYKKATRSHYPDAAAAIRSARYRMRLAKSKTAVGKLWSPASTGQSKGRLLTGTVAGVGLILAILLATNNGTTPNTTLSETATVTVTHTATPAEVILIIPDTATPPPATATTAPTTTRTPTLAPTATPKPAIITPTITITPTLRPAPQILEPKNGQVWSDGTIVFEFKPQNLAYDELYCLNTLRGFDHTLTENWSYPPVGNKKPSIPIEANVFRIARLKGMQCVVWSVSIGKDNCDNLISKPSEERIIGLPHPCDFK